MGWLLWSTQSPSGMLPVLLAGTWQQESAPRVTFVLQPSAFQGFAKPPYAWHCRACEVKGKKEFSLPSPPHREGQVPCQKATLHLLGMALKQAKPQSSSSARGKGNFLTPTEQELILVAPRSNPPRFPLLWEAPCCRHLSSHCQLAWVSGQGLQEKPHSSSRERQAGISHRQVKITASLLP